MKNQMQQLNRISKEENCNYAFSQETLSEICWATTQAASLRWKEGMD